MPDPALITLSHEGLVSARALRAAFPEASLHAHRAVEAPDAEPFTRVADLLADLWEHRRGLVLFAPTGAVVRALAPLIQSKYTDPAVVVCDVYARWAVSLLSGHEGGANDLCLRVANALGSEPVITTTTEAVKDLVVGLGCRRGTEAAVLCQVVEDALEVSGLDPRRVRYLASADLKADEPGLREAAGILGLPLRFLPSATLRQCPLDLSPSEAAERNLGLPGVAEPAARLAGWRTEVLLPRTVLHGCTVAIARECWAGNPAGA